MPAIEVEVLATTSLRKVQFRSSEDLITDFTPYCKQYGVHPARFNFDARGYMVRAAPSGPSEEEMDELLSVGLGHLLECTEPAGMRYRSLPSSTSEFRDDVCHLEEGDQVEVLERRGEWIRDVVGWLPLVEKRRPCFSVLYL